MLFTIPGFHFIQCMLTIHAFCLRFQNFHKKSNGKMQLLNMALLITECWENRLYSKMNLFIGQNRQVDKTLRFETSDHVYKQPSV